MSQEEKFEEILQDINEIYLFLTQEEPTPDYEIEAREKLIKKIRNLKKLKSFQVGANMNLFERTMSELENWDTLDLWFIESKVPELIQNIINLSENLFAAPIQEEVKETVTSQPDSDSEAEQINIDKIVNKVSEQFKGEIDGLKHKIDLLEHEIEKKDDHLREPSTKKVIRKIKPRKNVKLIPPKIKIPIIRGPDKPPKIKGTGKSEIKKPKDKIGLKSIGQVQAKIEEKLEKLRIAPVFKEESIINKEIVEEAGPILEIIEDSGFLTPLPPASESISEAPKESESILDILEASGFLTPSPPASEFISETPKESESILDILKASKPLSPSPPASKITSETPKESEPILDILKASKPLSPSPPASKIISETPKESEPIFDILKASKPLPPSPPAPKIISETPKEQYKVDEIPKKIGPPPPPLASKIISETPKRQDKVDEIPKKIGSPPPPPASKIISETPKRQDKVDEIPKKIGPPPPPPPTSRFISETPKGQDSVYDIHKKLGPPPPPPTLPTTEFVSDTIKESESILAKDLEYLSAFIESETVSELPDDMPKLGIAEERQSISETFEDSREPLKFPEPNVITEMPEELKESKLTTEISLTETDTSEKKNFIPFITKKPKIVSVSVEETETESIKSSGTDLFNVFSSVGGTNNEKTVNKIEPFNAFSSISVKEKKKKEDKKKKKEEKGEGIEKEIQAFDDITTSKSELTGYDDSKPLPVEELPADKDSLYQELIALEGRRYSLEKNFKEIEKSFNTGAISDFEHTKQKVELNLKLEEITSRINKIRRVISSL
ncbi:hypothetical protein LCGC14_1670660 [marine sediment metagenome]|uniref:Uncharacterized protein n=1 Tax=marine sediment metagenome TaxID=412755 RepID=A0A0F9HRF7_9ZZZZ